jgi:hypothetical protein
MTSSETPDRPDVDRTPPAGYEWPGADAVADVVDPLFWLTPEPGWSGTTARFMVMCADDDGEKILAQRCYSKYGVMIVDALRRAVQEGTA